MKSDETPATMLYRFHVNVFACAEDILPGPPVDLRETSVTPLRTPKGGSPTFREYLPVTFEQALDSLAKLPRLDAEPDGFFVIAGACDGQRWQVDGHLYDFNDRLHRVELHGQCPPDVFDAILACLGWPATPLAFELVLEGVALNEFDFRKWASRGEHG